MNQISSEQIVQHDLDEVIPLVLAIYYEIWHAHDKRNFDGQNMSNAEGRVEHNP